MAGRAIYPMSILRVRFAEILEKLLSLLPSLPFESASPNFESGLTDARQIGALMKQKQMSNWFSAVSH